jgi:hypothetical protein
MAVFRVTTPVPGHTGDVADVRFTDGVALVDDAVNGPVLAYCRAAGYGVEPHVDADPAEGADEAALPKRSASTEVWRAWAVEHGGLEADEAETYSRDRLVERFTSMEESE